eukprot:1328232-Rhodomonas_salina.1
MPPATAAAADPFCVVAGTRARALCQQTWQARPTRNVGRMPAPDGAQQARQRSGMMMRTEARDGGEVVPRVAGEQDSVLEEEVGIAVVDLDAVDGGAVRGRRPPEHRLAVALAVVVPRQAQRGPQHLGPEAGRNARVQAAAWRHLRGARSASVSDIAGAREGVEVPDSRPAAAPVSSGQTAVSVPGIAYHTHKPIADA